MLAVVVVAAVFGVAIVGGEVVGAAEVVVMGARVLEEITAVVPESGETGSLDTESVDPHATASSATLDTIATSMRGFPTKRSNLMARE